MQPQESTDTHLARTDHLLMFVYAVGWLGISACVLLSLTNDEYTRFKTSWMVVGSLVGGFLCVPMSACILIRSVGTRAWSTAWVVTLGTTTGIAFVACALMVSETGFHRTTFYRWGGSSLLLVETAMAGLMLFCVPVWMTGISILAVVKHRREFLIPAIAATATTAAGAILFFVGSALVYVLDWSVGLDLYMSHEPNADRLFAWQRTAQITFAVASFAQGALSLLVIRLHRSR
ncbi:MAG: hypothetical protein AAGA29_05605 [Planctomycetota bacterium]